MELKYPFIICIGIPIFILLVFIKSKTRGKSKEGRRIANTKFIKDNIYYKQILKKYRFLFTFINVIAFLTIITSFILLSRLVVEDTQDSSAYSRDIFLCMDVSTSVNKLNEQIVENLKETVEGLKGERIGICIFNTSSVLLVPLTEDYEYVLDVLDTLKESLSAINNAGSYDGNYIYLLNYIITGTTVGNEQRGSSLVGDGLASCVYNFVDLDEERARIIIFSTDNEVGGQELFSLKEAAQIAKENKITVFSIAPSNLLKKENLEELREATELTGGVCYTESSSETVSQIISNIEKHSKSLIKGKKQVRKIDIPQVPFVILVVLVIILFVLYRKAKL